VLQTSIRPDAAYQNNNVSPSYRQIVDTGNLGRSQAMHAPGQSGHLGSPHYGDMIQPWLNGGYFSMTWDWAEIARNCRYRHTFAPADH
jgi:penicillin amidase